MVLECHRAASRVAASDGSICDSAVGRKRKWAKSTTCHVSMIQFSLARSIMVVDDDKV